MEHTCKKEEIPIYQDHANDFEFQAFGSEKFSQDICIADQVFSQGVIIPSKPFSDNGGFSVSQVSSRCVSRSDSMDHYSSGTVNSSTTSSSRSSSFNSRSQYSPAFRPSRSLSNNFYAQPSPSPRIMLSSKKRNGSRKSMGSSPWGIFRLGLMKTPEIELDDMRSRRMRDDVCYYEKICGGMQRDHKKAQKKVLRCFSCCKCSSSDVMEAMSSLILFGRKKDDLKLKNQEMMCRNPTFECNPTTGLL
ncbi:hypothetical protein J5N97_028569 [Dioscorea zingiberensis]|uniref:Uncharacterized protein n=1 Tax=Dioscorea zingiberensis TaxID=325984 RepID=A0A9D5BZL5_9LILI|nr:hypothetical protein J5N97_028569 [Dioscorea zingiberensis]